MSWIFSFIILLTVCHCLHAKKSSDESSSEEKLQKNVEPYKRKKPSFETKYRDKENKNTPRAEFRFKIEESGHKEDKPIKGKEAYKPIEREPSYTDQNKNKAPKRARESSENKEKEKIWRFELDLPEILRTLKKYTGVAISDAKHKEMQPPRVRYENKLRTSDDAGIFGQKIRVEMKPPNVASLVGFFQDMFGSGSSGSGARRQNFNRWVEEQPGVIKSQPQPYPAYQEAGQLQALLEIKKQRQKKEEEDRKQREEEENRNPN